MARFTNLGELYTGKFLVTASGTPEQLSAKKVGATIAFVSGLTGIGKDTITDSVSGFLTAGFQIGDTVAVSGSTSNDGSYKILTVTAGTITLNIVGSLTDEGAAATVKITANKTVPDGIPVVLQAGRTNTGTIYISSSTEKALNTAGEGKSMVAGDVFSVQASNLNQIWIDSTVSGEGVEIAFEKEKQYF
jgi:hypothetical protein